MSPIRISTVGGHDRRMQASVEIAREHDPDKPLRSNAGSTASGDLPRASDGWACISSLGAIDASSRSDQLNEDEMIAATAQMHGLTVVTRNVRDFDLFGVKTLNPFK